MREGGMALRQQAKATTTVTKTVTIKPKTLQKLRLELKGYAALKATLDATQAKMDEKKATIGELRESTGEDTLSIDGYSLALVQPIRKVLNQEKLISLGCAVAWIEEATENVPSKPYEKIVVPK
jgi:hypothetical protein